MPGDRGDGNWEGAAGLRGPAPRACAVVSLVCAAWLLGGGRAEAQLGNLISPGRLARAHSQLEGLGNCQKCHEQGNKVTTQKCLICHKGVADRIASQTGVHRDVKGDCVKCHIEHAAWTVNSGRSTPGSLITRA